MGDTVIPSRCGLLDGDPALQQEVLNTLARREEQITLIQTLLKSLHHEGYLRSIIKPKKGLKADF